ncbi:hypothetical protein [Pantanalinema sp. GBBB05]|uniref:hypothetical protein n=1 Tax=Pantanalinema sp. GBBB05 TaxID=2604139 RepID=UPI001D4E352D|nr:hypothetical protein [Pantanalinema sp. GBBB05]
MSKKQRFPERYPPNWDDRRRIALSATSFRCVLCNARAEEVHHAYYSQARLGCERVFDQLFPLCKLCHKIAHRRINWIWDKIDPCWGNRNTEAFRQQLLQASVRFQGAKITPVLKPATPAPVQMPVRPTSKPRRAGFFKSQEFAALTIITAYAGLLYWIVQIRHA